MSRPEEGNKKRIEQVNGSRDTHIYEIREVYDTKPL